MTAKKNFTLYLLKPGFDATNSLKDDHNLRLYEAEKGACTNLPSGASLYYAQLHPKAPWWKNFWGIDIELTNSSACAIVFLPVKDRYFALTYGTSYHKLKENCYEHDFGLIASLNALDPEKIKSSDFFTPGNAKRQRVQMPAGSELTAFDINTNESIIKKLTGSVLPRYSDLISNVTGSSNLKFATAHQPDQLIDLCARILELFSKDDYKQSFPNLFKIMPVKDPDLIGELDQKLIDEFHGDRQRIMLAIPEIVDYSTNFRILYHTFTNSQEYEDVALDDYLSCLIGVNGTLSGKIEVDVLKKHKMIVKDENGSRLREYSIYKTLLFDCSHKSKTYHLCDGSWYVIDQNFIDDLKNSLDPIFLNNHEVLCECKQKREDEYNIVAAENAPEDLNVFCLDKMNIAPKHVSAIEPCDLICIRNDRIELIHNKKSTRSSNLSHLFSQGYVSAFLLSTDAESKDNLLKLLDNNKQFEDKIKKDKYTVVYGIISHKPSELRSDALPFFSRVNLSRTVEKLKSMRIATYVYLIDDETERTLSAV